MKPWENEEFVKEVYTQTKERLKKEYKSDIIALFHVEDHVEAYLEDADTISGILGISPQSKVGEIYMVRFSESDIEVSIRKLTDASLGISLSEIRDENGICYLDAYREFAPADSDNTDYESEYPQLISYKYKNKTI